LTASIGVLVPKISGIGTGFEAESSNLQHHAGCLLNSPERSATDFKGMAVWKLWT
jgi:hypothetical protein